MSEPRYSRSELIDALGVTPDYADRIWNAFGFPWQMTDDKIFTEEEVAALRVFAAAELTTPTSAQVATARAVGQSLARLADWQADQLRELDRDPDVPWTIEQMTDSLSALQGLVWRKHLALALERSSGRTPERDPEGPAENADEPVDAVVGFADIVGYTSLSRRLDLTELEELLESFEERTHEVVSAHGGHVIKTLGDAVMFTFDDPAAAAAAAIAIHRLSDSEPIPPLRVGLALGHLLRRLGDVFGEPVNIAARLCGSARPGTTLVGDDMADALADDDRFYLKSIPPLSVRGYRRLRARLLEANRYHGTDRHR
ncbi:adenylate/guanylate cyclase domain-containing protein [Gordonia sp. ABSL1-1]|uniref:adenylate/guanylate cyclase domain-containing protein n=1 Tax=Gordonia sp. ABSL1-1 TaxID=3053923 RepID=UPI0025730A42|nr:adenylate/guanylate cyclase domain-containing protein [Gordonia sp. ABSL1-1]MDL9935177.1 adenylate/guanylate cyclase domain-containing protein [Gordonia sp. ABSL1-1]